MKAPLVKRKYKSRHAETVSPIMRRTRKELMPVGGGQAVTLLLVILTLIPYVLLNAQRGFLVESPTPAWMVEFGGNLGPLTAQGQAWRLVSSLFLHYGFVHLLVNAIALFSIGRYVDYYFGRGGLVLLFLVSGFAGGVANIVWGPVTVMVGASPAIFGLYGAILAAQFVFEEKHQSKLGVFTLLIGVCFVCDSILRGLPTQYMGNVGHVIGMTTGFLVALGLTYFRLNDWIGQTLATAAALFGFILCQSLVFPGRPHLGPVALSEFMAKTEAQKMAVRIAQFHKVSGELRGRVELARKGKMREDQVLTWIHKEALPRVRSARSELHQYAAADKDVRAFQEAQIALLQAFESQMLVAIDPKNRKNPRAVSIAGISVQRASAKVDALAEQVKLKYAY
ncbi:MAG: rhomboid family intramembrane serine protease [Bdellovibrionaceae bacterium]|nr:rhomboid family intramembrane serine protease [Pseudobdellovibrionaceae bacterium]